MANVLEVVVKLKDQASAKMKTFSSRMGGLVKQFASFGSLLMTGAVAMGIRSAIKALEKQEMAVAKLNGALRAAGTYSVQFSKALQDQAAAFQQVTIYGDESVIAVQSMLIQMGIAPEMMKRATAATLDWATAMGKDAFVAAMDLGKAAAGNLMMLQRYGIQIDKATFETEGFGVVLDAVEGKVKGMAEALAKKGTAQLIQFGNTVGDTKEKIAEAIVPSLVEFTKVLIEFLPWIELAASGVAKFAVQTGKAVKFITGVTFAEKIWKEGTEKVGDALAREARVLKDLNKAMNEGRISQEEYIRLSRGILATHDKNIEKGNELREGLLKKAELLMQNQELVKEGSEAEWEANERIIEAYDNLEERIAAHLLTLEEKDAESVEKRFAYHEQFIGLTENAFSGALTSMLKGEEHWTKATEKMWKGMGKTAIGVISEIIVQETIGAAITKALETSKAQARATSAHAGIPFIGLAIGLASAAAFAVAIAKFEKGGIVTRPTLGILGEAGPEAVIPLGRGMPRLGTEVKISSINIQFPAVTTFEDWLVADPHRIKEVTERKILQAFRELAVEGKMEDIVTV